MEPAAVVKVPPMVSQHNLDQWSRTLLEDEYSDVSQSQVRGEPGQPSGWEPLSKLSHLRPSRGPILDVGCGSGQSSADYFLDPNPRDDKNQRVRRGWMESIPFPSRSLDRVVCWGTFCFLRSQTEALMEANRVLTHGGSLILDVVTFSTFALCQTVEVESFCRHLVLHGFSVHGRVDFGQAYHQRTGILAVKDRDWDPSYFRALQATSEPRNYLESRDWPTWTVK